MTSPTAEPALERVRPAASAPLLALLLIAVIAVMYGAADLLVPIAFSLLLNLLLSPVVKSLQQIGIPTTLSAGVLVTTIVGLVIFAAGGLAGPAERWIKEAPQSVREFQNQAFEAQKELSGITELAKEVDELAASETPANAQEVVVKSPGVLTSIVGSLPSIAAYTGIVLFLTFFLLASGDTLLRRITRCGRTWTERRRIVSIARQIQSDLSRYLGTVTVVNLILGATVALVMHLLNVPNPLLWGAVAGLFNFAPYVGALATTLVLTVVGISTFDSLTDALVVPLSFVALTILEGQLITPTVLGRRLAVHPLIVFLAIIFWGWLWGVAGALMAVPIITSLKVVADHVPRLSIVASFFRREGMSGEANGKKHKNCKSCQRSLPLGFPADT